MKYYYYTAINKHGGETYGTSKIHPLQEMLRSGGHLTRITFWKEIPEAVYDMMANSF